MRGKCERGKGGEAGAADVAGIEAGVAAGTYTTLAQFDADVASFIAAVIKENGRFSTLGAAAAQIKKVRLD